MHAHMPPFTRKDPPARAEPTAAISDTESKLRTALAYVNHALGLLREALGDDRPASDGIEIVYDSGHRETSADFTRDRDATGA